MRSLVLVGLFLSACDRPPPEHPPQAPATPAAELMKRPTPGDPQTATDPAKAIAAALAAAADAEGATPCERAYSGLERMRAAAARSAAASTTPPAPLPPRERFLAGCAPLPADLQRCLDLRW